MHAGHRAIGTRVRPHRTRCAPLRRRYQRRRGRNRRHTAPSADAAQTTQRPRTDATNEAAQKGAQTGPPRMASPDNPEVIGGSSDPSQPPPSPPPPACPQTTLVHCCTASALACSPMARLWHAPNPHLAPATCADIADLPVGAISGHEAQTGRRYVQSLHPSHAASTVATGRTPSPRLRVPLRPRLALKLSP